MYKQFILPALLFVFSSVVAMAQSTAAPAGGTPQKKTSTEKSTSNGRQQPTEARTEENLPKGAKVKKSPSQKGKSKGKGKAKGHTKDKAQGKAEGHHKDDATGTEGAKHQDGEHHDGEHHQNDGTEMKKTETPGTTPNKGETTPVRKAKKPAKTTKKTTPTTGEKRTGSETPAATGGN